MISTNRENCAGTFQSGIGGELSRIMLAIKTLLADKDDTETLIFDEIDTGISGRTAQKVAGEKMAVISRNHQIICIYPSAADCVPGNAHYLIEKNVEERELLPESAAFLMRVRGRTARMLGGAKLQRRFCKMQQR